MIKKLAPREKMVLWTGAIAVLAYILIIFIGKPLYQKLKNTDQNIQSKVLFINKYKAILSQRWGCQQLFYEAAHQ